MQSLVQCEADALEEKAVLHAAAVAQVVILSQGFVQLPHAQRERIGRELAEKRKEEWKEIPEDILAGKASYLFTHKIEWSNVIKSEYDNLTTQYYSLTQHPDYLHGITMEDDLYQSKLGVQISRIQRIILKTCDCYLLALSNFFLINVSYVEAKYASSIPSFRAVCKTAQDISGPLHTK